MPREVVEGPGEKAPCRNGYKERSLKTIEGPVEIHLPQVRNASYSLKLLPFKAGHSFEAPAFQRAVEPFGSGLGATGFVP